MSLVEELSARVRGTAEELPLGTVTVAAQRLRVGLELLQWVRQESVHEVGVVHLANALEQLEAVALAVRTAQDDLAGYLGAIGMSYDAAPTSDRAWRESLAPPEQKASTSEVELDATPLGRWWSARVDELTGAPDGQATGGGAGAKDQPGGAAEDGAARGRGGARDSAELLRRIAAPVRAGDRDRLRAELRRADTPAGLGLSAITPPVARHLATELLGHEPAAADLPELTRRCAAPVHDLLPGVPEHVLPTLLARVCRTQPPVRPRPAQTDGGAGGAAGTRTGGGPAPEPAATHPTDPAVAGAVLVGVLLHRLGRDPETLDGAERVDG